MGKVVPATYKFGSNIAELLAELTPVDTNEWRPTLQVSIKEEDKARESEDKQYAMESQTNYNDYHKHLTTHKINQVKAYVLLWERSTKGMKNKIKARSDFKSKIYNNPIELLIAIKEHALNYQEN